MQLFYFPEINDSNRLDGDEAHHIIKVLRKKNGDSIHVTNGKGEGFIVTIINSDKKGIDIKVEGEISNNLELHQKVNLIVAPTKNIDRFEWMVEKATELGVSEIIPIRCKHSERKNIQRDRIEKVAIAAMKQSGRFVLPLIHELTDLKKIQIEGDMYFAHCREGNKKSLNAVNLNSTLNILIGPEGDFHEEELNWMLQKKWQPLSLGETRLRTETAAIYTMAALKFRFSGQE